MSMVVTANRLCDGAVVFLGAEDRWVERLDGARVLEDKPAAEAALAGAKADEKANLVLDLYVFDVVPANGRIRARHIRDAIRAAGPTVRPDHGKQASRP